MSQSFPYLATAAKKYRSPHAEDLSFPKGASIRVLSIAPRSTQGQEDDDDDDDEDEDVWLVGEMKDGTAKGTFPANCVVKAEEQDDEEEQKAEGGATSVVPAASATATQDESSSAKAAAGTKDVEVPSVSKAASIVAKSDEPPAAAQPSAQTAPAAEPAVKGIEEPAPTPAAKDTATSADDAPVPIEASASPSATTAPAAKSGPPPPKPKPSGLAARIAAFNQPQAQQSAPPPLPRGGKPAGSGGGWKRPAPKEGEKPVLPGQPPAVAAKPVPAPAAAPPSDAPIAESSAASDVHNASQGGRTNDGFSAADAASSIKMSLKERMAALQRGGGESGGSDAPAAAKSPPPLAAKPGRLTKERSAAALVGVGGPAGQSAESLTTGAGEKGADSVKSPAPSASELPAGDEDVNSLRSVTEGDEQDKAEDAAPSALEDEPSTEPTEEESEAQRRAAIAQRMARLGGQRFGGPGPAMFGAPKPPAKKASTSSASTTGDAVPQVKTEEEQPALVEAAPQTRDEPAAGEPTASAEEEQPKTLNVPRRTAPPRRKRSALPSPGAEGEGQASSPAADSAAAAPAAAQDAGEGESHSAGESTSKEDAKEAALSSAAQREVDSAPVSQDAIHDAPSADLPDEDPREEAELVSGAPPKEQAVHTEKVAIEVGSAERAQQLDEQGEEDTTKGTEVHEEPEDDQDDAALRRQSEQLNSFLRDPSRQQSSSSIAASSLKVPSRGATGAEADESGSESGAIPAALAQQLGLEMTSKANEDRGETSEEPEELGDETAMQRDQDENAEAAESEEEQPVHSTSPPPRPISTSSTSAVNRPPIPTGSGNRTSIPPPARTAPTPTPSAGGVERSDSRASSTRPPVPRSPPPPPRSPGMTGSGSGSGHGISEVLQRADQEDNTKASVVSGAAPLAAPRPRHAMPAAEEDDDDDDDDDEDNATAPAAATRSTAIEGKDAAVAPTTDEPGEEQAEEAEPELTEEEQEAARRAAIAKRMAALGGQRMGGLPPIMGAPMPPRRKQTSDAAQDDADETAAGAGQAEEEQPAPSPAQRKPGAPPRGGMAIPGMTRPETLHQEGYEAEPSASQQSEDEGIEPHGEEDEMGEPSAADEDDDEPSAPIKPLSPPPVSLPTMMAAAAPRPPTLPSSPPPRAPMSPPPRPPSGTAPAPPDASLERRRSAGRPPIPQAQAPQPQQQQRRQPSIEESLSGTGGYEEDDEDQVPPGQAPASPPQRLASPPPPPRAPPRVPPAAPGAPAAGVAQSGSASSLDAAHPTSFAAPASQAQSSSPQDLDLLPHTAWWRSSPLTLPPTITSRPDTTVLLIDHPMQDILRVVLLFEDNSTTTIRVTMRGDAQQDQLEQIHSAPPAMPGSEEEAKKWSGTVGVGVAKEALLSLQSRSTQPQTSYGFLASLLLTLSRRTTTPASHRPLPPVSPSSLDSSATPYGVTVLSQVGGTVLERGPDATPRPGDVVVLAQGAEFRGKKSGVLAGTYTDAYPGTCAAIVVEWEAKKHRCKVVGVLPKAGANGGSVEETTLRFDDLKAGVLRVVRLPPVKWVGIE
ncbi:hypothetical protein BDZ90DRAFT_234684 [Jaminaea rosea]|uniref:SH3 domain-containing protein n=1 Tax=Jaminaea rosea TaxID=1569628 RepID=A0A316UIN4_9BASI|nr:hypothetical protein BDZ90DRAFT_234684 [Jaminaea rosea]PWN24728.1 hypothetical protein BDZ90DRAFT_234684 [Jaminaea rosea]